jgi:hypothetical protein
LLPLHFCHADTTVTVLLPLLPHLSALPPPLPCCHRLCRSAAVVAVLPPQPLLCLHCCCHPAAPLPAATKLPLLPPMPLLRCLRHPHAANTATTLLTVAALLPCCLRCSANAATALPMLPSRCRRPHCSATPWLLPSHPDAPLLAAAKLPLPLSLPPMRCCRRPCTADASAALRAIASLLPRCLCRSADAATALPPLSPRCRCCCPAACRHSAAAVLLLPMLTLCCRHCHRTANTVTMLQLLPPLCRCLLPCCPLPLSCCRHHHCCQCAAVVALTLQMPPPRCFYTWSCP